MKLPKSIYILNKTDEEFRDRFDGEEYVFPPGKFVQVPIEAAKLIFGYSEPDKLRAIRRLGWAVTSTEMEKAQERLRGFQFHAEPPYTVHQTAPVGAASTPLPPPDGGSTTSEDKGGEGGGTAGKDVDDKPAGNAGDLPAGSSQPANLLGKLATAGGRG